MKRTERIFTAALLGLALFGSCTSQTDEPTIGEALQISVVAQGFASGDAPATRTADAGYTTGFVAGDEIGITVIASDGASILHNNVRCTYNGTAWTPASTIYKGATHFAYYPYSASMNGKQTAAEIIEAFSPQTNQSDYATGYAASDLMTGVGTVSGTTLQISLDHALALVEINLPQYGYAPKLKVNSGVELTPYRVGNRYRCIVKPAAGVSLHGLFTYCQHMRWQKTGVNLEAGKYVQITPSTPPLSLVEDPGVLINGVRWATRNVDAPGTFTTAPENAGMLYQWNRRVGWSNSEPMVNSNGNAK